MKAYTLTVIGLGLLLSALHSQNGSPPPQRLALLIGIDQYSYLPQKLWLGGAGNDVDLLDRTLRKNLAMPADDILKLTDAQATRRRILRAFQAISAQTKGRGGQVVVVFSGYGSRRLNGNSYQPTIVPADGSPVNSDRDIGAGEIISWLRRLAAHKTRVMVIYDCGHSCAGHEYTGLRSRYLERPGSASAKENPLPCRLPEGIIIIGAGNNGERLWSRPRSGGKIHGWLSYYLAKAIERHAGRFFSYPVVFGELKQMYARLPAAPLPYLLGKNQQKLFAAPGRGWSLPLLVTAVDNQPQRLTVDLGGGSLRGITPGSLFALVRHEQSWQPPAAPGDKYFVVQISQVTDLASQATLISRHRRQQLTGVLPPGIDRCRGPISSLYPGWQAIELVHNYDDWRLRLVAISAKNGKAALPADKPVAATLNRLAAARVIRLVDSADHADALVQVAHNHLSIAWTTASSRASGLPRQPPREIASFAVSAHRDYSPRLERILLRLCRVRNLLALAPLANNLSAIARLVRIRWDGRHWQISGSLALGAASLIPRLRHGDKFGIEFSNAGEQPVYPTIIHIDSQAQIKHLFPTNGRQAAVAVKTTSLLVALQADTSQTRGRETAKILVTSEPQDFSDDEMTGLAQTRSANGRPQSHPLAGYLSLARIIAPLVDGQSLPLRRDAYVLKAPARWAAINLVWEVE